MGVLSCSRRGCDNVMCDRYSSRFGYICWECFNEMVAKKIPTEKIEEFLDTKKVEELESPYTEEYYNKLFPLRYE